MFGSCGSEALKDSGLTIMVVSDIFLLMSASFFQNRDRAL